MIVAMDFLLCFVLLAFSMEKYVFAWKQAKSATSTLPACLPGLRENERGVAARLQNIHTFVLGSTQKARLVPCLPMPVLWQENERCDAANSQYSTA